MAEACYADDQLMYNEGNILNFMIHVETLKDVVLSQKRDQMNQIYHVAIKKLPVYDSDSGETKKPDETNGYKLELFVHNFLQLIDGKFAVLRVKRDEEFGVIKNAEGAGKDSPEVARMMIHNLHSGWLRQENKEIPEGLVEVNFLESYEGENL